MASTDPPSDPPSSSSNPPAANTTAPTLPIVISITQEISSKLPMSNYLVWKMHGMPILRCHGLLGLVDGMVCRPSDDDSDIHVVAWLRFDQMVLAWIASSLSDVILPQLAVPLPSVDAVTATLTDFESCLQAQQATSLSTVALAATAAPHARPISSSTGGRGRGNSSRGRGRDRSRPRAPPVTELRNIKDNSFELYKIEHKLPREFGDGDTRRKGAATERRTTARRRGGEGIGDVDEFGREGRTSSI
ncbi:hypothetical protein Droror1_Dr00011851 [Drosera rotundifolia]